MNLLDKFKNLFTDEEEEMEEEIPLKKEEKKEDTLPTFMREKIKEQFEEKDKSNNIENTNDLVKPIPKDEVNINTSRIDHKKDIDEKKNFI